MEGGEVKDVDMSNKPEKNVDTKGIREKNNCT
jgi:hypothetical protein